MKLQDLKKLNVDDLEKELLKQKKEMFNLNSVTLTGEDFMKKKSKKKSVKLTIARIKTLLNNKEL
ncbi:MAG: 50S ribosomal protein L29 [Candidatus Nanoarchaeia archaeon]